jgi:hypothetical protein
MRAKTVWRYQFPREPLWRNHRLKEPMERMRELHAGEADARRVRFAPTSSRGFGSPLLPALGLPRR